MPSPHVDLDEFAPTVDVPDNSDLPNPSAGALNVGTEGTLDRTNYLRRRREQELGQSWRARVVLAAQCDHLAWSPFIGQWWCVGGGNTDQYTMTNDYGLTWSNVSIGGLLTKACYDIAFDLAGDAMIANDGDVSIYVFDFSTTTWSSLTPALIGTVHHPRVAYDPVSTLWLFAYCDTTHGVRAAWTPDGHTITDVTAQLPGSMASASTFDVHLGAGGGRFVVAAMLSGAIKLASQSGGALGSAWASASITPAFLTTLTDCSDPVYSAENGKWAISLWGSTSGNPASEVWTSADGGMTWTHAATIGSSNLQLASLAAVGLSLYGLSLTGDATVFSNDMGATWYSGGVHVGTVSASKAILAAGGGGLLAIDHGGASVGSRATSVRIDAYQSQPLL